MRNRQVLQFRLQFTLRFQQQSLPTHHVVSAPDPLSLLEKKKDVVIKSLEDKTRELDTANTFAAMVLREEISSLEIYLEGIAKKICEQKIKNLEEY